MTSVLNVDTIADKAGTGPVGLTKQHAAKAWNNFTMISSNTIRGSFNVSSFTDNASGDATTNYTNSFADINYVVAGISGESGSTGTNDVYITVARDSNYSDSMKVGSTRITSVSDSSTKVDRDVFLNMHGDLA